MATTKTNTNKTTSTSKKQSNIETDSSKTKIKELEDKLAKMTLLLEQALNNNNNSSEPVEKKYEEINPNKKTKVTSLRYGTMTLYAPTRGYLRFTNYGQTLTLTFAQLTDYVNQCRAAAEKGWFYIHDEKMVEELALTEYYGNILKSEVVDEIIKGNVEDFEELLSNLSDSSKETLSEVFASKVYEHTFNDLNIVDRISRAIGIDIITKTKEMKEIAEFTKEI